MKFQCWHMTNDGAFYNAKGETTRVEDVKVVVHKDKSGEKEAKLYARDDAKNEHPIKADHFKVKYLKPAYPATIPGSTKCSPRFGLSTDVGLRLSRRSHVSSRVSQLHRLHRRSLWEKAE